MISQFTKGEIPMLDSTGQLVKPIHTNAFLYVYNAKSGKLYSYDGLDVYAVSSGVRITVNDKVRFLPSEELEVSVHGSFFSVWSTKEAREKVVDILKLFANAYAIEKTKEANVRYNKACKYYRNIVNVARELK